MVECLREALERVDRLLTQDSYDDVIAALDECTSLPDAATVLPGIWQRRLCAMRVYGRPDDEIDRALNEHQHVGQPLLGRAADVIGTCADRPDLARRYLLPLIDELEAAAADPALARALAAARIVRGRTLGSTGGGR